MQYLPRLILAWCLILLGTFFLAKAIAAKGQKWTMKELLGLRIDKLKAYRNHIIQRLEAAFGFFFVLSGISIHLYVLLRQSMERQKPGEAVRHTFEFLSFTLVAIVVLAVAFHYVCKYVSRRSFVEILAYLIVRYRYRIEDDQALMKEIGDILRVKHDENDTVESYARRVEDAMGLDKLRAKLLAKHKQVELD